jgi:glutamate formiminotransferase
MMAATGPCFALKLYLIINNQLSISKIKVGMALAFALLKRKANGGLTFIKALSLSGKLKAELKICNI